MPISRILVMGAPGSGKLRLARQLGQLHGLPVFHLDQFFWRSGWVETPPEHFAAEVERLAALPAWVIDGNYSSTLGPRMAAADLVVYLDPPRWRSMLRLLRRTIVSYGRVRADAAPGCADRIDLVFVRDAWAWNRMRRDQNLARVASFPGSKNRAENKRRPAPTDADTFYEPLTTGNNNLR